MPLAEDLSTHLPYLRRFARALTGSQSSGDSYVLATLEALVNDPAQIDSSEDLRVGLFSAFMKIWNSIGINLVGDVSSEEIASTPADRKLDLITPQPRQAFLLVAMEGFVPAVAARILSLSEVEVSRLVAQATAELSNQIATDVLIIEDEPLIALDLEGLMDDLGHKVVAKATTRQEAVDAASKHRPGLVLADIQLADGTSGIDAVNDLLADFSVPVVFITAYPERLLTGNRPEPVYLLTKPFQPDMVKAIVSQALFLDRRAWRAGPAALKR